MKENDAEAKVERNRQLSTSPKGGKVLPSLQMNNVAAIGRAQYNTSNFTSIPFPSAPFRDLFPPRHLIDTVAPDFTGGRMTRTMTTQPYMNILLEK